MAAQGAGQRLIVGGGKAPVRGVGDQVQIGKAVHQHLDRAIG